MSELNEIIGRMGNEIMILMGSIRNLSLDYQNLIELLTRLLQSPPTQSSQQQEAKPKEPMGMRDRVILTVRDKNGKVKQEYDSGWSENGITNAGMAEVAGLILTDVGGTAFDYIAIGTGTTAFDPTQTALVTEIKRKAGTGSRTTTTVTNDTAQLVTTFSSADGLTGTSAVTESGVFNASTGGTMLARQVFSALNINWGAGEEGQKALPPIHVAGDLEIWRLSQTRRFKLNKPRSLQREVPVYVGRHIPSFFYSWLWLNVYLTRQKSTVLTYPVPPVTLSLIPT